MIAGADELFPGSSVQRAEQLPAAKRLDIKNNVKINMGEH
jgi:hypothetical protein